MAAQNTRLTVPVAGGSLAQITNGILPATVVTVLNEGTDNIELFGSATTSQPTITAATYRVTLPPQGSIVAVPVSDLFPGFAGITEIFARTASIPCVASVSHG